MRAADRGVSEGAVRHNLSRARELLERSTGGC
jgi:DNA-directed RNA polymerase specialized sigma24 family protein